MELVGLAIIAVVVLWLVGGIKSARKAVDMANNEINSAHAVHKDKVVRKLKNLEINADDYAAAKEKLDLINSFEL
jgi:hypothetical protein